MAKAPTKKSRMIASVGLVLLTIGLVLDAWFSPPLPRLSVPFFGSLAVFAMQFSKKNRESDGLEIPKAVAKQSLPSANAETLLAAVDGLSVTTVLMLEAAGTPKQYQQIATVVALTLFAFTAVVFRFTRIKFEALMVAAGVDASATQP